MSSPRRFFDLGRSVLPLGNGALMHLVVAYGFQGDDEVAEKLGLTDQLFDAALCELAVVSRGQRCCIAGEFNVEPTRYLACSKVPRLGSGLIWELLGLWRLGNEPAVTCKRDWACLGGTSRDLIIKCPLAAAALGGLG